MKFAIIVLSSLASVSSFATPNMMNCISKLTQVNLVGGFVPYVLFLVDKDYLADETKVRLANGEILNPMDFAFKDTLLETQKHSLRSGLISTYNSQNAVNEASILQTVVAEKLNLKKDNIARVEQVKKATESIWHKPKMIRNASLHGRSFVGDSISLSDGSLILFDNKSDKFYLTRSGESFSSQGLVLTETVVIENPSGFNEPFILVGMSGSWVKIVGAKGKLIKKAELSRSKRSKFEVKAWAQNGKIRVLVRPLWGKYYEESARIIEFPRITIDTVQLDRYQKMDFSKTGRVVSVSDGSSIVITDLEDQSESKIKGNLSKLNWYGNYAWSSVSPFTLVNLETGFVSKPSLPTKTHELYFMGAQKNKLMEDLLYFRLENRKDDKFVELNAVTGNLSNFDIRSITSEVVRRFKFKNLYSGTTILVFADSATVYFIRSDEKQVGTIVLSDFEDIVGINEVGESVSIVLSDTNGKTVEYEVYGPNL